MDDKALLLQKEWEYCEQSFSYFFRWYWKVLVPGRGVINVDMRQPQMESAQMFQDERRVAVLKARQIGWSTLVSAYTFWLTFFHYGKAAAVLSRREDPDAIVIVSKIKLGYDLLPMWMKKRGPRITNDHQTKIIFSNLSTIESDSSKDNPIRGRTFDLVVLDEFGKFPNPEQAWQSAMPATEYGQLLVIGNANFYGSRWWTLYTDSKKGLTDFVTKFYPWNIDGMGWRTDEWLAKETSSMTPQERAAEYPNNDEECWMAAGSPVFDVEVIKEYPVEEPLVGIFNGEKFVQTENGWLKLWVPPVVGRKYVIGADTARGLAHGDYSAAVVFDQYGTHVASLHCHLKPVAFATALDGVGRWYNNALLGVESNKDGAAVLDTLTDALYYPNLYQREIFNEVYERVVIKYGWETTDQTKPIAITQFNSALIAEIVKTKDVRLITEILSYRYLGDGKMGGSPHDDMVMAGAIANQMFKQLWTPKAAVEEELPKKPPSKFADFDGTFYHHARVGLSDEEINGRDTAIVMNRYARHTRRVR